jgi:WS/DGAT/MGAT family acyltransferase
MAHYKYERLSAQDNDFLRWESDNLPMHGGGIIVFDAGSLATADGGVDFATIKRGIESVLHKIPRYRQKLAWIPDTDRAVWIDDATFNIDYHIRHTALPRPGSEQQLKQLGARIAERRLDRLRPLWELWVVEGLDGGRFATIWKTHHCVVDGMGGMDLLPTLLSTTPEYTLSEPHRFIPRPAPSEDELLRDDRARRAALPLRALGGVANLLRDPRGNAEELGESLLALGKMARFKAVPASDTPLNGPVGPHRVLDWLSTPLSEVKEIRKALECSVNDVVLAIVTGAVREFLIQRQVRPETLEFRVATPVNVRREADEGSLGNRVSSWIVPLPIGLEDPVERVAAIHATTTELKESHQAAAVEMVEALHEWIPLDIQALSTGTQNAYVTNLPGPQMPLYFFGAEMLETYLFSPLLENLGLAIGVLSYNGRFCWGLTADYDRIPDVSELAQHLENSFEELAAAAGLRVSAARGRRSSSRRA